MERGEIVRLLKKGVCEVTFLKKDGSIRVMHATLEDHKLPPSIGSGRVSPTTTLPVFDVEAGAWRSFILANVIAVVPLDDEDDDEDFFDDEDDEEED
jgi:hypothetical protein